MSMGAMCVTMYLLVIISSTVFGWFQNSFIGIEQDLRYSLQAGYRKGTSYVNTTFCFDVVSKVENASMSFYDSIPLCVLSSSSKRESFNILCT